jgi:2-phospho-L-lactate guanylyltransferase (CobY/MobA/RfbA family)
VIAPTFGPPSLDRHTQAGLTAGAVTVVRTGLGLAQDVDTPEDLANVQAKPLGRQTAAAVASLIRL